LAAYGGISIIARLFTAAGAILLALVFARLGRTYPEAGGPYAHSRRAFGEFVGLLTAWGHWIAIWAGNAVIAATSPNTGVPLGMRRGWTGVPVHARPDPKEVRSCAVL